MFPLVVTPPTTTEIDGEDADDEQHNEGQRAFHCILTVSGAIAFKRRPEVGRFCVIRAISGMSPQASPARNANRSGSTSGCRHSLQRRRRLSRKPPSVIVHRM